MPRDREAREMLQIPEAKTASALDDVREHVRPGG